MTTESIREPNVLLSPPRPKGRTRLHFGSALFGYALAAALTLIAGFGRLLFGTPIIAPFFFFYPAFGATAFLAGIGPGLIAVLFSGFFVAIMFHVSTGAMNWISLVVLGPLFVVGFARLREVRDRSRALAKELERFKYIGDHASDWILLLRDSGHIHYANRTASADLGWPEEDLVGRPLEDFVREEERGRLHELIDRTRHGSADPVEFTFVCRDGTPVLAEIGCTGVRTANDHIVHVAARDITGRRQFEQKLREARLSESLGVMAGGIAHDFNNLLTSILGNAALARDLMPPRHEAREMLDSVIAAGERSADLVRMMLAVSGYRSRETELVDLEEVLGSIVSRREMPHGITVSRTVRVEPFQGDRRSLETLLRSLIANAAESYSAGSGQVRVTIRPNFSPRPGSPSFEEGMPVNDPKLGISVEDFGSGMSPEVLERAFDPFFSTKFTGRGLGLPAVRGIVRSYGGSFRLFTQQGQGTCVEIYLPLGTR